MRSILKLRASFLIPMCCMIFSQISPLEAGGWGKTEVVAQHEGTIWNEVYFDMNGLNLSAHLPNYQSGSLQNGEMSLKGFEGDFGYLITTSFNPGFKPPKKANEFVKMIQDANPSYVVKELDSKKLGAKYAVDLIPKDPKDTAFWRFLSTKDRLIQMGTDDTNANRRTHFFESVYIK